MELRFQRTPELEGDEQYEFETYTRCLATSSDRARHVVIISLVASVLVFAAFRRSAEQSWWSNRTSLTQYIAANTETSIRPDKADHCANDTRATNSPHPWPALRREFANIHPRVLEATLLDCLTIEAGSRNARCKKLVALYWLQKKGYSAPTFEAHLAEMEAATLSEVIFVEVPFLGIKFDINDLGTFSAIGQCLIAIILLYSIARHHENLYLCLWKVRKIAEAENRYDDGNSKANLLYHAMAMTQVLSRPPTLARWAVRTPSRIIPMGLFFIPILVQLLVLVNDLNTGTTGSIYSSELANQTFWIHFAFGIWHLAMTIIIVLLSRASEVRWRNTFFAINPGYRNFKAASHWEWLWPHEHRKYRFVTENSQLRFVSLSNRKIWIPSKSTKDGISTVNSPCFNSLVAKTPTDSIRLAATELAPEGLLPRAVKEETISPVDEDIKSWYFGTNYQSDGYIYQVSNFSGGNIRIIQLQKESEMGLGRWTIRKAAIVSAADPKKFVEISDDFLLTLEEGVARQVTSLRLGDQRGANSRGGIVAVAALRAVDGGPEIVVLADRGCNRLQKIVGGVISDFGAQLDNKWNVVALCGHGSEIFVAESKRLFLVNRLRIRIFEADGSSFHTIFLKAH